MKYLLGLVAVLMFVAGCGGGGTPQATVRYRVLDVQAGTLGPMVAQVGVDPAIGRTKLVFVRIPAGNFRPGQANGTLGRQGDEAPGAPVAVAEFWLAAHELTQAQWLTITANGDRPWLRVLPADAAGVSAGDLIAAYGLTATTAQAALTDWNAGAAVTLALPSDLQWEYACKAGGSGLFHWGDSLDPDVVAAFARLEALGGPAQVAQRLPNAFALFDMHGNVREWTSDGNLRGGGWSDHPLRARSANHIDGVDGSTLHALSGLRPVLIIP